MYKLRKDITPQYHGPNLHSEANLREILVDGKVCFACFVDLEKAFDRVPRDKLWKVLQNYGVNGQLLRAILQQTGGLCSGKWQAIKAVPRGRWTLERVRFVTLIVYMNWIDKCSPADECATIGNCKISRLLFADDLVLLSSTKSCLQRALNSFADACNTAGIKISTAKTEVLHLSRSPLISACYK